MDKAVSRALGGVSQVKVIYKKYSEAIVTAA